MTGIINSSNNIEGNLNNKIKKEIINETQLPSFDTFDLSRYVDIDTIYKVFDYGNGQDFYLSASQSTYKNEVGGFYHLNIKTGELTKIFQVDTTKDIPVYSFYKSNKGYLYAYSDYVYGYNNPNTGVFYIDVNTQEVNLLCHSSGHNYGYIFKEDSKNRFIFIFAEDEIYIVDKDKNLNKGNNLWSTTGDSNIYEVDDNKIYIFHYIGEYNRKYFYKYIVNENKLEKINDVGNIGTIIKTKDNLLYGIGNTIYSIDSDTDTVTQLIDPNELYTKPDKWTWYNNYIECNNGDIYISTKREFSTKLDTLYINYNTKEASIFQQKLNIRWFEEDINNNLYAYSDYNDIKIDSIFYLNKDTNQFELISMDNRVYSKLRYHYKDKLGNVFAAVYISSSSTTGVFYLNYDKGTQVISSDKSKFYEYEPGKIYVYGTQQQYSVRNTLVGSTFCGIVLLDSETMTSKVLNIPDVDYKIIKEINGKIYAFDAEEISKATNIIRLDGDKAYKVLLNAEV